MHTMLQSSALPIRNFAPNDEVISGVLYGRQDWVPTPAYWATMVDLEGEDVDGYVSLPGTPLAEDLAFCLLGGYGVKMELNRAAWEKLADAGVFVADPIPSREEIEALLSTPLSVNGRLQKYRYPRQRAGRLHTALNSIKEHPPQTDDSLLFREQLMELPG